MFRVLKCVSARLCRSTSSPSILCSSQKFPSYEYSPALLKCLQARNITLNIVNNKERSDNPSEETAARNTEEAPRLRLTTTWKWVVRGGGRFKVAAFQATNNPAIALNDRPDKFWHSHKCANCQLVYEHTHPYSSLHHPQHIKDCPNCRKIAPADMQIL